MTNDEKHIRQLLQKFMAGTTTLDEERAIGRWFREHPSVPADLADYRTMFAWFDDGMPLSGGEPQFRSTVHRATHRKWLWPAIAVAASAAIALGIFMPRNNDSQADASSAKPALAVATARDSVSDDATAAGTQKTDTVKPQINVKERKEPRRYHRRMFEPVPAPPLYARTDSTPTADEPQLAAIMEKVNRISPVTEETEDFINAALEQMDRSQQAVFRSVNEQNSLLDDVITATISDGFDYYYDDEEVH